MRLFRGWVVAMQFLTRIPLPFTVPWEANTLRWALCSFSLVGIVIGFIIACAAFVLSSWISLIPLWMLALIIVTLWVLLTGGLHIDGWADTADAIGSRAPLDKQWEIMKDPRIGTSGTIAVMFLLLWKLALTYATLAAILETSDGFSVQAVLPFLWIPAVARWGALGIFLWLPAAQSSQLAVQWKKHLGLKEMVYATIPILMVLGTIVALLQWAGLLPLTLLAGWYGLFLLLYRQWVYKKFRAVNGDLLGAFIEGSELWLLIGCWLLVVAF